MSGSRADLAIEAAFRHGNAIVKFITRNEVGTTGSHQYGYFLPKPVWSRFTEMPPTKGVNTKEQVVVNWAGVGKTESSLTWYGKQKNEYRLTRFGKGFPFLDADCAGDLLVLVRTGKRAFDAFVVEGDAEAEHLLASLDMEIGRFWGVYSSTAAETSPADRIKACLARRYERFASVLSEFPDTTEFSREAVETLLECDPEAFSAGPDESLMRLIRTEYEIFRHVERKLCSPLVTSGFADLDAFLKSASSIMNRRKARAGRSLENHVSWVLKRAKIPHAVRPEIPGQPDIVIPDVNAYETHRSGSPPVWIMGIKSTCKDRWRQVIQEAPKVAQKYLMTVQPSIASKQIAKMREQGVTLVVPAEVRQAYARADHDQVLTLQGFIDRVHDGLRAAN